MLVRSICGTLLLVYLCAASSPEHEDDSTPHTKFRDKRTLNFILHGLASLLGYRLERQEDSSNTATTTSAPVILLPITNTKAPQHYTEKYQYPQNYNIFKVGTGHGNSHTANYDIPKDCNHGGRHENIHHKVDYNAHNRNNNNGLHQVEGTKAKLNNGSKNNRQKVDEYLEKVGYYIKNRLKEGNSGKIQDEDNHGNEKDVHSKNENSNSYVHFKEPNEEAWESDHSWPYDSGESEENKMKGKDKKAELDNFKKEKVQQKYSQEKNEKITSQNASEKNSQSHIQEGSKNTGMKGPVQSTHQIPPPPPSPLQNWEEDFWSDHYTFTPNSAYSFNVPDFNADGSSSEEHKHLQKSSDYTFDGSQQNSHHPEDSYSQARYTVDAVDDYAPIHSWHVTSDGSTDKSTTINGDKQASYQSEQEEISPKTTEAFESSNIENSDSLTTTSPKEVPDNPPMPILSTVKPKLAQLIHEVEGTKQNPLWPPPFDHAFESTDSSIAIQHPENTENAQNPNRPLLLNLYNYTSISDYLLDLSAKNLKQKQQTQKQKSIPSQQMNINSSTKQKEKIQPPEISYLAVVVPHEANKMLENDEKPEEPKPSYYGILYPHTHSNENENSEDSSEHLPKSSKKEEENEINNSPTQYKISHVKELETRNGYNIQHSEQHQQSLPLPQPEETKNGYGNQQAGQRQQYEELGFYYNPYHQVTKK